MKRQIVATINGQPRKMWQTEVECPDCHTQRWVYVQDADHQLCRTCAASRAGKANWQKLLDKVGYRQALAVIRDRIDKRPSAPERKVREWLNNHGLDYRTNVLVFPDSRTGYIVDFEVNGLLIELDGHWHTADPKQLVRDARMAVQLPHIIHLPVSDHLESDLAGLLGLEE